MITIHVHRMRVDARSRRGAAWLDITPRQATTVIPSLTVFLEPEDVPALRRQLDEVLAALAAAAAIEVAAPGEPVAVD